MIIFAPQNRILMKHNRLHFQDTIHIVGWNNAGKMTWLQAGNTNITFDYSPLGQRQRKTVSGSHTDYYLHDATGNLIAIYRQTGDTLRLIEKPIYGSSRLGVVKQKITFLNSVVLSKDTASVDIKSYELTDHLGNVTATFTDRKHRISSAYIPIINSVIDYYPFGYPMPGRSYELNTHRFGFNGQESDNEIYGGKQSYTAEFWQYDARLGRRWNIDPIQHPSLSPFSTFAGNPIRWRDPMGIDTIYHKPDGSEIYRKKATGEDVVIKTLEEVIVSAQMPEGMKTKTSKKQAPNPYPPGSLPWLVFENNKTNPNLWNNRSHFSWSGSVKSSWRSDFERAFGWMPLAPLAAGYRTCCACCYLYLNSCHC